MVLMTIVKGSLKVRGRLVVLGVANCSRLDGEVVHSVLIAGFEWALMVEEGPFHRRLTSLLRLMLSGIEYILLTFLQPTL